MNSLLKKQKRLTNVIVLNNNAVFTPMLCSGHLYKPSSEKYKRKKLTHTLSKHTYIKKSKCRGWSSNINDE